MKLKLSIDITQPTEEKYKQSPEMLAEKIRDYIQSAQYHMGAWSGFPYYKYLHTLFGQLSKRKNLPECILEVMPDLQSFCQDSNAVATHPFHYHMSQLTRDYDMERLAEKDKDKHVCGECTGPCECT